ncbi:MAG TPA: cation:proton antiporter [Bacteroidia bacterium]|nr:cation:proton antiporter [Bacteroidia bacterium]
MMNLELFVKVVIALITIIVFAQLAGRVMKYIGQPAVVGEMISGVLLGPTLFGYLFPELSGYVFPEKVMPVLYIISNLGLSLYMFLVGAELNLSLFTKSTFKYSAALSFSAIIVPFIAGGAVIYFYNNEINTFHISTMSMAVFMGVAFAITAFPMLARILQEKNILHTKLGTLSLLSASIQDVISWIFLGIVTIMCTSHDYSKVAIMIAGAAVLTIMLFYLIRPLLNKIAGNVHTFEDLTPGYFGLVLLIFFVSVLTTDVLGLYSVFGGFIFGVILPRRNFFIKAISMRLKDITIIALLPVFFAFSGLNTNLIHLGKLDVLEPTLVILVVAFASKHLSCMLTMRYFVGFDWGTSSAVGGLMNSRGLMELIIANIGLSYNLIDQRLYSILVLIAIVTTLAAMPIYNASLKKTTALR